MVQNGEVEYSNDSRKALRECVLNRFKTKLDGKNGIQRIKRNRINDKSYVYILFIIDMLL